MAEETESVRQPREDDLPSAGARLRKARAARGLTREQVAQSLHLDPWILEALEEDRFSDVGAPVFAKGHLRKVAAEVGVPDDDIMEAYYRSENAPEMPGLVTEVLSRPAGERHGRGPIIAVSLMILALIVFVVWLWLRQGLPLIGGIWPGREAAQEPPSQGVSRALAETDTALPAGAGAEPAATAARPPPEETADASPRAADNGADPSPASGLQVARPEEPAVEPEPVAVEPEPVAADGQLRFSVDFVSDSWVEIYDADNRRLFFDMARGGSTRTVIGVPPLQVLLGNAEDVRMTVNGDPFAMPAGARRGKTARFTVR